MDTPHLTIAEAIDKTGRSASTLRRLIRTIADDSSHPDREGVQPSPEEVEAFKKKGENFTWKIREDLILKHLKGAPREEKKSAPEGEQNVLQILSKELDLKNQQIEKQLEVIQSLNERLREGNILMGTLQRHLSLPAPNSPAQRATEASTSQVSEEAMRDASKKVSAKMVEEASAVSTGKPAKKKGIFSWMRR